MARWYHHAGLYAPRTCWGSAAELEFKGYRGTAASGCCSGALWATRLAADSYKTAPGVRRPTFCAQEPLLIPFERLRARADRGAHWDLLRHSHCMLLRQERGRADFGRVPAGMKTRRDGDTRCGELKGTGGVWHAACHVSCGAVWPSLPCRFKLFVRLTCWWGGGSRRASLNDKQTSIGLAADNSGGPRAGGCWWVGGW